MVFDVAVFILTVLQALQVRETWCGGYFGVILRDGQWEQFVRSFSQS